MTRGAADAIEVSVVIPCFNGAATLGLQLEALASQRDAPPFEVLVVDNRSTDATPAVIAAWQDRVPGLRRIVADGESGAAYARNVGAAAAAADLLLFCDADDVVASRWVAHGVRDLEVVECFTGSAIDVHGPVFGDDLGRLRQRIGDAVEPRTLDFDENDPLRPILCGGCFGITRERYLAIGGFDTAFGSAGEDNEFAWRWMHSGEPLPVSKSVRIAYRGDTEFAVVLRKTRHAARSMVLLAVRYDRSDPMSRTASVLRNALAAAVAVLKGWAVGDARLRRAGRQRLAASLGAIEGIVRYRWLRRVPAPRRGHGFDEGVAQRRELREAA